MSRRRPSPIGERFGRLVVLADHSQDRWGNTIVMCKCDCGSDHLVRVMKLRNGNTKSCGCLRAANLSGKGGGKHVVHSERSKALRAVWKSMISRCSNERYADYPVYGGRGIRVCERWQSFWAFVSDMGYPLPGEMLERVDNDGGYSKNNCVWATPAEQARNKRSNVWIEVDGSRLCRADAAKRYGIRPGTLRMRLERGWGLQEALTAPPDRTKRTRRK